MKSKPNSLLRILSAGAMAVIVLVSVNAQQPSSSPEQSSAAQNQNSSNGNGDALGGYAVISSIEFGYRGLSHDGDHNKYRSDLNYSAGPRLFDASFLLKAKDGSGAEWYARSKLAGTRQLVALIRGNYSRPIPTPVHNLRPADETCGHCHWSEKFHGAQLKTFNHYAYG